MPPIRLVRLTLALLLAVQGLLAAGSARATICGLDDSPAATLLLPYFEVDLVNGNGRTTLFSINNWSDQAVLTNVTLWTDLGVPTLAFQVYLTGYDLQTINLRDVFNGFLPRTASAGQDPSDVISPQGDASRDIDYASCNGILPLPAPPASLVNDLRAAHTGRSSTTLAGCGGQFFGDDLARGYVTIDTVSRCEAKFPSSTGYFGTGGMATNQNVLWGDYYFVDQVNNSAAGDNLVRLEADPTAFHAGDTTFYGRYIGFSAADGREPLASVWATRYVSGGAFTGGTELLVWREHGAPSTSFNCFAKPSWYPLDLSDIVFFDEQESPERPSSVIGVPPPGPFFPAFPAEANRVKVGSPQLSSPFDFGWAAVDFGRTAQEVRPVQAFMATMMSADGRFSVGYNATPLVDVCSRNNPQFGQPGR